MKILVGCIIAALLNTLSSNPLPLQVNLSDVTYENGKYTINGKEINGEIVAYHENQKLKLKYKVTSGRLQGEAITYYNNGQPKNKRYYTYNKLFGEFTDFDTNGNPVAKFKVDLNAYGKGETVLNVQLKKGKKLKDRGDGVIYFLDESGTTYSNSEEISIFEQTKYVVKDAAGEVLYQNF